MKKLLMVLTFAFAVSISANAQSARVKQTKVSKNKKAVLTKKDGTVVIKDSIAVKNSSGIKKKKVYKKKTKKS